MVGRKYNSNTQIAIGELLKIMRQMRRMTQAQLSATLSHQFGAEYSISQISRFEKGESGQPMDYVIQSCKILTVHPLSFMIGLLHPEKKWQRVSVMVDSGAFFYEMICDNFYRHGEQLLTLERDDLEIAKRLVQTYFSTKFELELTAPCRAENP